MKKISPLIIGIFTLITCTNRSIDLNKVSIAAGNNTERQKPNIPHCITLDLKIVISNSYHDTTLTFRNSISNDSSLLVICDTNQINYRTEKVLLESKYLPWHQTKGYYSFLTCIKTTDDIKEVGIFNVQINTTKAWEIRRFRINNYKIDGLICLPGVVPDFMSTEEYDSLEHIPVLL
jgi:hypothetical protein